MSTHHVCRLHEISAFAQNLALKNFALGINTTANTTAMVGLFYSASYSPINAYVQQPTLSDSVWYDWAFLGSLTNSSVTDNKSDTNTFQKK